MATRMGHHMIVHILSFDWADEADLLLVSLAVTYTYLISHLHGLLCCVILCARGRVQRQRDNYLSL